MFYSLKEDIMGTEMFTVIVVLVCFTISAGLFLRRMVQLLRKDSRAFEHPRFNRFFDLLVVLIGTYATVGLVTAAFSSPPSGWVDYLVTGFILLLVAASPVLAAMCVMLVNRHLDSDNR